MVSDIKLVLTGQAWSPESFALEVKPSLKVCGFTFDPPPRCQD